MSGVAGGISVEPSCGSVSGSPVPGVGAVLGRDSSERPDGSSASGGTSGLDEGSVMRGERAEERAGSYSASSSS